MALKEKKRKYGMADSSMAELGDSLVAFAERDLTEMTGYGYNQARIDQIKAKIAEFKDFAPDEYYVAQMMGATTAKNTALAAMGDVAEGVVRRAITKWGKDTHQVRAHGWAGYAGKKDAEKTAIARLVHKSGTDQLADLGSEGLTAAILTDLNNKITAADTAITAKASAVALRDQRTNERVTLGNEVYDLLVDLADTGKHIWEDVDESRYNDYLITDNPGNTQTATASIPAGVVHAPSVVVNEPGDEIQVNCTEGKIQVYFSDDPTDDPQPGMPVRELEAGESWSGTAAELNWSPTNHRLLLKNAGQDQAEVVVRVVG
jgi:hypothetical protein